MPKAQHRLLVLGLIALDSLAVAAAVILAHHWALIQPGGPYGAGSLPILLMAAVPVAIALFAVNRLYNLDELLEGPLEYGRIVYGSTLTAFGLSVFGFWGKLADSGPSRRFLAALWLLSLLAVGAERFVARRVVRMLRRRGYFVRRALIVGLGTSGLSIARHFDELKDTGIQIVGFIDDFLSPGTPVTGGLKVLGPPSALPRILDETGASDMLVLPTAMAWESFQELIRTSANLNGHVVRLVPDIRDILATNVRVHQVGFMPLLTLERVRITGLDAWLKRFMDYGTVILLAPVVLPVIVAAALALALSGVRPFCATRVLGRRGGVFPLFSLNVATPQTAAQRVIRHCGVDRLPQLLNIVRGEMSLIGPHPVLLEERQRFERWLPNLLTVKPGMTGPWAVQEPAASLDEEMATNLFYIRNYTIWRDLEIAARSILKLATGSRDSGTAPRPAEEPAVPASRRAGSNVKGGATP
jgi:lipopolysaccharide/colanic/teichoic acid biosynthesis glycosyltransferase